MTMAKTKSTLANRALNFACIALLWARKGGLLKQRSILNIRVQLLSNHMKRLTASDSNPYGEYEFSCAETPVFKYKLHNPRKLPCYLPRISCINLPINLDDEDVSESYNSHDAEEEEKEYHDECCNDEYDGLIPEISEDEEEEIDLKAEEFIGRFYEGMRLQKQVSDLQYNEMLQRSVS